MADLAPADLTPGKRVHVKVTSTPTNASATKTLVRLLSKDPDVKRRNAKMADNRLANPKFSPRGGRWRVWESREPKKALVHGVVGEEATFVAGPGELADLGSVRKFVSVDAA
ncbi:hypothetical protein [Phycisphaera mikurensis]|uniref:Uncharacterized protein n=1 Tax=Phycisphaera mikurensis (strain NBRC 102666 / KCTC 22515 / FYK2301M01) TaxID=1142394 RepID=I0IG36_PHYMF|nr:hypothetical protein [Phycisphaera mikurensis]MBB6440392.1 hypothetical protein [Phycisphaera mikurensis]BAM04224.1 hypothetical protein PSMK_20650 [Phycisphaera mikurensis NBRC 102666]